MSCMQIKLDNYYIQHVLLNTTVWPYSKFGRETTRTQYVYRYVKCTLFNPKSVPIAFQPKVWICTVIIDI